MNEIMKKWKKNIEKEKINKKNDYRLNKNLLLKI